MFHRFAFEFERMVADIFAADGWVVELESSRQTSEVHMSAVDILASRGDGSVVPIEVKITRNDTVPLARLRDDSAVTSSLRRFAKKRKPLLVYGAKVERVRKVWAQQEFDIDIWDIDDLRRIAGHIAPDLEELLYRVKNNGSAASTQTGINDASRAPVIPTAPLAFDTTLDLPPRLKGEALIEKLTAIVAGNPGAKAYERICRDILEYLFSGDLRDGRSQARTADGLNIYDLIYRVRPQHPFWVTLTRDFRARVVLFECKNYGKPITAMQVFTTERYLSSSALRPICFVLSRKRAHKHAIQAAFGAMREAGKLLVFLSDEDLIQMLRAKDAQLKEGGSEAEMEANDPTEVLDQKIYEFIATIPR